MGYIFYQTIMIPNLPLEGDFKIEENMARWLLKWIVIQPLMGPESHATILCSSFIIYLYPYTYVCIHWLFDKWEHSMRG